MNIANVQAIPSGYSGSAAWVQAPKGGGMSSRFDVAAAGLVSLSAAMGVNGGADLTGVGTIDGAALQLIVSALADLAGAGVISGAGLAGKIEAAADLIGVGDLTAAIGALAGIFADLAAVGQLNATITAIGHMVADVSPFTELSPESLAAAVWASVIESGLTADAALKLIAAATAGEVAGAGTSTVTIRNAVADSKDRIIATVDGSGNRSSLTYDLTD